MKSTKKVVVLALCMAAIAAASVFGTMAYLTDNEAVTNTFTVGNVNIKLDEADVKTDGTPDTDDRVQANEYHLLPGRTYTKDPTVTVEAGSEDSYVRMIVTVEEIDKLMDALPQMDAEGNIIEANKKYYSTDAEGNIVFLLQMLCNGWDAETWKFVDYNSDGNNGKYEFRYKEVVVKNNNNTVLDALFDSITVPGEIDNAGIANLASVKIIATAHAIQADGFDTADAAWDAFN